MCVCVCVCVCVHIYIYCVCVFACINRIFLGLNLVAEIGGCVLDLLPPLRSLASVHVCVIRMCSLQLECVLFGKNVFSSHRMCSL